MGWLRNPFRRTRADPVTPAPAPAKAGDSPEDWHAGDLARCINDDGWWLGGIFPTSGPELGEIRLVKRVTLAPHPMTGKPAQVLWFSLNDRAGYLACAFRKAELRKDRAVAAEAEFIALVRKTPEPADV